MVGILVVPSVCALRVEVIVAGRSGSSYTAELGPMKMREDIDALLTIGLDLEGLAGAFNVAMAGWQ